MLIVKIIKAGKIRFHGCHTVEVTRLDTKGGRRVMMLSSFGVKRITDLEAFDTVILLNDCVEL